MRRFFDRFLPSALKSDRPVVPVIRLQGAIAAGGGQMRPNLSLAATAQVIDKAFAFKDAPAVALLINSPGGSAVQSRLIYRRIRDLAQEKKKHVIAFVEDAAASGGYMIACAADEIVADPSSIVGSIGVVYQSFGVQDLIARIGIESRVHAAGKNKVMLSPFQPEREQDVAHLLAMQEEIHRVFIDLVKERRGARLTDHPDLFTGLFWTGLRARELGLVDAVGDMRSFLKARFGDKATVRLINPARGLFGRRLALPGIAASLASAAAEGAAAAIEERALWSLFGL
ncbi:MAG: S49 family peptidase [Phyllobacteriaceae bacterium]|nr:S49 family peptidase [Phyllobacteriaceae bacterium]